MDDRKEEEKDVVRRCIQCNIMEDLIGIDKWCAICRSVRELDAFSQIISNTYIDIHHEEDTNLMWIKYNNHGINMSIGTYEGYTFALAIWRKDIMHPLYVGDTLSRITAIDIIKKHYSLEIEHTNRYREDEDSGILTFYKK